MKEIVKIIAGGLIAVVTAMASNGVPLVDLKAMFNGDSHSRNNSNTIKCEHCTVNVYKNN